MLLTKCTVLQNSFVKNSRNVCFERDHLKAWVAPSRPLSITIINQVPQLHGIFTSRHSLSQTIRAYTRTVFSSSSHTKCCVVSREYQLSVIPCRWPSVGAFTLRSACRRLCGGVSNLSAVCNRCDREEIIFPAPSACLPQTCSAGEGPLMLRAVHLPPSTNCHVTVSTPPQNPTVYLVACSTCKGTEFSVCKAGAPFLIDHGPGTPSGESARREER
ncbi:hypothetical protein RRG08_025888 [Elysia crispata]|uniref:Uncharacterized protein n=1 Tax=Elysia crispata TaxID=231223 RepID=A0AAE1DJX4_9GAST|nr:hypothetical protein RRG08_025888 [Elysia crispata]